MGEVITPAQQTVLDSQEDDDLYSNSIYLDAINNADDKQRLVTVLVESNSVIFKVDTGAEVTDLLERTFQSFTNPVPKLINRFKHFVDPTVHPLK